MHGNVRFTYPTSLENDSNSDEGALETALAYGPTRACRLVRTLDSRYTAAMTALFSEAAVGGEGSNLRMHAIVDAWAG